MISISLLEIKLPRITINSFINRSIYFIVELIKLEERGKKIEIMLAEIVGD